MVLGFLVCGFRLESLKLLDFKLLASQETVTSFCSGET